MLSFKGSALKENLYVLVIQWRKQHLLPTFLTISHLSLPLPIAQILSIHSIITCSGNDILISHLQLPKQVHNTWLRSLSSLSADAARKPQRVQELPRPFPCRSSSGCLAHRWFPRHGVVCIPAWRQKVFALLQHRGAIRVICEGRQAGKLNRTVSKEILFSALLKTLNHRMAGHCV